MAGPEPIADDMIGRTIDERYTVRRLIGRGGMGVVYEAEHVGTGRRVAIKLVLGEVDDAVRGRLAREARAIGKVEDDHVIEIFDTGTDEDGRPYLVMEYLEGRDLRAVLKGGAIAIERALALADQILTGLAAIHAAGLVHRDLKPANIFITGTPGSEHVTVMDFGISKSTGGELDAITRTGHMVGTPQYMAPEQLLGGEVDTRADLYSAGLTIYEMLVGRPPFAEASSTMELATMQLRNPPPPLGEARPDTPATVTAAVERALAKAPAARFASAAQFAATLRGDTRAFDETRTDDTRSAATVRSRPAVAPDATVREPPSAVGGSEPPPASEREPAPSSSPLPPPAARSRGHLVLWIVGGVFAVFVGLVILGALWPVDDDELTRARDAERGGRLELAIAHYLTAHESSHDPDLLFRIGELYERMDRIPDAVRYFRRYLREAPRARDRDAVTARIARLSRTSDRDPAPPRDAPRVPEHRSIDAGSGSSSIDASHRTPRHHRYVRHAPPETSCRCILPAKNAWLCRTKHPLRCRCLGDGGYPLCPKPFQACTGPCDYNVSHNGTKYVCPRHDYSSFHTVAPPNSACQGYSAEDIDADPAAALHAPIRDGKYDCSFCNVPANSVQNLFDYDAAPGTRCWGTYARDGQRYEGVVRCQERW